MVKKEIIFCVTLILIGTIDWITTLVGIAFFGATEANPLITGLTQTNMLMFSAIKLSAITLTGLAFYKAEASAKIVSHLSPITKKFVHSGYAICLLTLSVVVANNLSAIIRMA